LVLLDIGAGFEYHYGNDSSPNSHIDIPVFVTLPSPQPND